MSIIFNTGSFIPADILIFPISIRNEDGSVNYKEAIEYLTLNNQGQAGLEFDSTPTEGSSKPVTSDGVKSYVDETRYQDIEAIEAIQSNVIGSTTIDFTVNNDNRLLATLKPNTISESHLTEELTNLINYPDKIEKFVSNMIIHPEQVVESTDGLWRYIGVTEGVEELSPIEGVKWEKVNTGVTESEGATALTTTFTPGGNISSTNVQTAIIELDTDSIKEGDSRLTDSRTPLTHSHTLGDGTAPGFSTNDYTNTDKAKIDDFVEYTHPTGDGNLHLPATGTTSNGKVLKAGSTAGSGVWLTLTPSDVQLGNVVNESKATLFTSPALTGTPTAPTASLGTSSSQIATCGFVQANKRNDEEIQDVVGAMVGDSTTIDATYNDSGAAVTLIVKPSSITSTELDSATNTKLNLVKALPALAVLSTLAINHSGSSVLTKTISSASTFTINTPEFGWSVRLIVTGITTVNTVTFPASITPLFKLTHIIPDKVGVFDILCVDSTTPKYHLTYAPESP